MTTPADPSTTHGAPGAAAARRASPLRRAALLLVLGVLAVLLLTPLDRWLYQHAAWPAAEREDLHRLLRVLGFLPTWLIAAAAFFMTDWPEPRRRPPARRALFLIVCVLACGLAAEAVKLLVRRERPSLEAASAWVFRPFATDTWSTSGLSLPSSHAMVAFGGCIALGLLLPRTRPLWLLLAAGCAATRLIDQAHYLTDLVASGFLAWAIVEMLRPLLPAASGDRA